MGSKSSRSSEAQRAGVDSLIYKADIGSVLLVLSRGIPPQNGKPVALNSLCEWDLIDYKLNEMFGAGYTAEHLADPDFRREYDELVRRVLFVFDLELINKRSDWVATSVGNRAAYAPRDFRKWLDYVKTTEDHCGATSFLFQKPIDVVEMQKYLKAIVVAPAMKDLLMRYVPARYHPLVMTPDEYY